MEEIRSSILAVGGGKGEIGKSFFSSCLAYALSMEGGSVILIDADSTGTKHHTTFGIRSPEQTFEDYMKERVEDISDILIPTPSDNLLVLCGASDILEIANPRSSQKKRMIQAISELGADYIVTDIGASVSPSNLDFFNMADMGFIVTSPERPSVQSAYGFLKLALLRRVISQFSDNQVLKSKVASMLEGETRVQSMNEMLKSLKTENEHAYENVVTSMNSCNYRLVLNRAPAEEGDKVARTMVSTVSEFLNIDLKYVGAIDFDREMDESIRTMVPFALKTDSPVTTSIRDIVQRVTSNLKPVTVEKETPRPVSHEPITPVTTSASKMQVGLNNDVTRHGMIIHVQTEDLGFDKKKILTLVFSDGRILFSKTTDYSELGSDGIQKNIIERVNWQHRAVLSGIQTGKLDEKLHN